MCIRDRHQALQISQDGADSVELQEDLTAIKWSEDNSLPFNINKCGKITFSRNKQNLVQTIYKMGEAVLPEREWVRDLGIIMDKKSHLNLTSEHNR